MRKNLNRVQKSHVASLLDKLSFAYFAAIGYASFKSDNWLLLLHAIVLFVIMQAFALWVLGGKSVKEDA